MSDVTWNGYVVGVDWASGNGAVPTLVDVEAAVTRLLDANGWTTTLHVKTLLRQQGFWVSQREVSDFMQELAADPTKELSWTQTDKFRTYTRKIVPTAQPIATPTVSALSKKTYKVQSPFGGKEYTFVVESRGQAKYQWSKETGLPFFMARATRID